jgi:hypothetical protein
MKNQPWWVKVLQYPLGRTHRKWWACRGPWEYEWDRPNRYFVTSPLGILNGFIGWTGYYLAVWYRNKQVIGLKFWRYEDES